MNDINRDDYDVLAEDTPETAKAQQITYIPVRDLHPHPDNPRKDLGDLTELAESIKENGVLQNLTVVLGAEGYTVVIGHRRLAAAKEAGLTELPCIVTEMTKEEQLSTMLLENMQRSDLTVYEEAKGMQMLLDLGQSVYDIAGKTGLSETTVRRRVKLLDLDQEKFKEAQERGATLADYVKLDQIEDPKLKNEVLAHIGTSDFNWKLNNAISTEKNNKKKARWVEIFTSFATQVKKTDGYKQEQMKWMGLDPEEFITPKDANEVAYFFCVKDGYIYLLKEKGEEKPDPEAEKRQKEQEELTRRRIELETLFKNAYELRKDFVSQYIGKKDDLPKLVKAVLHFGDSVDLDEFMEFFDIGYNEEYDDEREVIEGPEISSVCEKHPYAVLLASIFIGCDASNENCYNNYYCKYLTNSFLAYWYKFLESLGYQTSTEEQQLLDGTHELYVKPEAE